MSGAAIGCGEWTAMVANRGGGQAFIEVEFNDLSFNRVLNQAGQANVSLVPGSSCYKVLRTVEPWEHELVFYRGDEAVFAGPITAVESDGSITASDLYAWMDVRFLEEDKFYTDDVSNIFHALFDIAMAADPSPNIEISTRETGVKAERSWQAEDFHSIQDLMRELSDTALDFTVVNRRILAGGLEVFLTTNPIIVHDDGVTEATVTKEGTQLATDVAVFGPGIKANVPRITGRATRSVTQYGLIQRSFAELQIKDGDSADQNALGRVLSMLPAPRRVKATVSQGAAYGFNDLVPGKRAEVELTQEVTSIPVSGEMRLVNVGVSASKGSEVVDVDLIPTGLEQA